jgi:FkbM family methyltransferase
MIWQRRADFVKALVYDWHKAVARSGWLASGYLRAISALCRYALSPPLGARIASLMTATSIDWPEIAFGPRSARVGTQTEIRLIPHLGEFDQAVLFKKRLDYETPVFCWLERNAASYDLVIEIGANIGIYSVFLDALIKSRPDARLKGVIAFEPGLEPFGRLLDNLRVNETRFVMPFQAAVANATAFRSFFEPKDHLTNGSLVPQFAGIFSPIVRETTVIAIGAGELDYFFRTPARVLVKIDVEGYEPYLMAAFKDIVLRYRPDFLIEVLAGTPEALEGFEYLRTYERFLLTPEGPVRRPRLEVDERHRDWLLQWPASLSR